MRLRSTIRWMLAVLPTVTGAQQSEPIAITARHMIDGTGRQLDNAFVVVQQGREGARITSVGPLPADFRGRKIDLGDATIMAGLSDVHSHGVG